MPQGWYIRVDPASLDLTRPEPSQLSDLVDRCQGADGRSRVVRYATREEAVAVLRRQLEQRLSRAVKEGNPKDVDPIIRRLERCLLVLAAEDARADRSGSLTEAEHALLDHHRQRDEPAYAWELVGGYPEIQTLDDLFRVYEKLVRLGHMAPADGLTTMRDLETGVECARANLRLKKREG
jgi:hypothetical protein